MSIWRRRRPRGDDGFTLMDAIAGMAVMGIFMVIFTGSIVMMFRSSNRSQAVTHTSQQVNSAFLWLDREVRYADYISAPGQDTADGGNWYVEFRNTDPTTQDTVCHQLRVDQSSGQLQQRSWTGSDSAGGWQPLATGVTNGNEAASSATRPFVFTGAIDPSKEQQSVVTSDGGSLQSAQLTVNLDVTEGQGTNADSSHSSVTLVAFNTNVNTPSHGICEGKRP